MLVAKRDEMLCRLIRVSAMMTFRLYAVYLPFIDVIYALEHACPCRCHGREAVQSF